MSEENNEEPEIEVVEPKKEFKLHNTVTDDDVTIQTDDENAKKLKELIEMQNNQNNEILKENTKLKQKLEVSDIEFDDAHRAPKGGTTAPLNDGQIYGEFKSKPLSRKIQTAIDDSIPIEDREYNNIQDLFTDLNRRANKNEKTDEIDENANKILGQLTLKVAKTKNREPIDVSISPQEISEWHKKQRVELRKYRVKER